MQTSIQTFPNSMQMTKSTWLGSTMPIGVVRKLTLHVNKTFKHEKVSDKNNLHTVFSVLAT